MACTGSYFIESDHTIAFGVLSGFVLADVKDLSVTLTFDPSDTITVTKTFLTGGVQIVSSVMSFILTETDITIPGRYSLTIMLTDQSDNTTRLTPCPSFLDFEE